ncbi:MAG: hypothetical protein ACYCZX_11075 [Rhodospirillaceae bacterium]
MTVRSILFGAGFLAAAGLMSGCSKTEEHAQNTTPPAHAAAAPSPNPPAVLESGKILLPADTAVQSNPQQTEREAQLEFKASAAEARARLAEIELREQTARARAQQQQAAEIESARAASLAVENAVLRERAENAAARVEALENEQRAVEAERAAYGVAGSVIVVQPPQRHGYGRPGHWSGPQLDGGPHNVGLNRPAIPDLTPPGPPATFSPPKNTQPPNTMSPVGEPKFDNMRARKGGLREAEAAAPAKSP